MGVLAAAGPSAYWYLTRGTGTVALILLTLSVALGVANVRRLHSDRVPRFVLDAVHRNVSLLAMAFLLIHILTSVLDSFAPIRLIDTIIPFAGLYRPLWLGLGTVAFDLLLAVIVTSLVRRRVGYGAWRLVHWTAYASWPVALLHGLGTGSDTKQGWMLVIVGGCVILAIVAVVSRATAGWPEHVGARVSAVGAAALLPLGLLIWLPSGPLDAAWAKRAGTPSSLLRATATSSASRPSGSSTSSPPSASSAVASGAFTARASGTIQQGQLGNGLYGVDISLSLSGQRLSTLAFHLRGQPIAGGGLQMTSSEVSLGTSANSGAYRGVVTALQGTNIAARVRARSGHVLNLVAELQIDPGSGSASGKVTVRP